jgi:iron complex outermembrane receptor protein
MRETDCNFSKSIFCVLMLGAFGLASIQSFAESNTRNRMLEEVVVTAQKREENSQDVPITMAALGSEKLEAFGIEQTADLEKIIPGLTFTQQYGYTVIYLRGVGSESFLPNSEPSIASYVDGINIASAHGKSDAVGPVERIEVLKGPQGTLYGRSATGGAINIISKSLPAEGYEGFINYGAGNYDDRHAQGYFSAALTDSTGVSFSYYKDQRDNINVRAVNGVVQHDDKEDFSESYRVKLIQDFGENIRITGIAQKTDVQLADADKKVNIRPAGLSIGAQAQQPSRLVENDKEGQMRTDAELYGWIFEWQFDVVALKFVYSDQESLTYDRTTTDYDGTSLNKVSFFTYNEPVFQKTYEFQLSSTENSWMSDKLTWVAGYYHLEGGGGFERIFFELSPEIASGLVTGFAGSVGDLLNDLLSPVTNSSVYLEAGGKITIDSDSIFAEATYSLTPSFNITLGARYQEETRGLINSYFDIVNPIFGTPTEEYFDSDDRSRNIRVGTFNKPELEDASVAPRVALQWFASDDVQVYSSVGKGFKSQTYNILNFFSEPDEVDKSETTSLEIGFKSDLLDSTLRLNGAFFNTITKNPISAFVGLTSGGVVNYFNAKESTIKGGEVDLLFQPMPSLNPGLVVSGGASYIEAKFSDFKDGRGYDEDTGLAYGPGALTLLAERDFTGNDVPRTPAFSSNIAINQGIELGDFGYIELAVDYAFKDSFYYTASNTPHAQQAQYELYGARMSWMYEPKGITLTAYVNNIKDEDYYVAMVENDFGVSAALAPPRLYGAKIKIDF